MSKSQRRLSIVALVAATTVVWGGLPMATAGSTPGKDEDRLTRAASANKMSVAELKALLRDPAAELGAGDRVLYTDPEPLAMTASTEVASASAPVSQTFQLHSKPGSQHTIFLDFDGALVTGTAWNAKGLPEGTHEGWDPAKNGASFSDSEKLKVQDIWARVAEDYAPFDVDVTTEDPGTAAIDRSGTGDSIFGTRVVISDSAVAESSTCGSCGGTAYFDVFNIASGHARLQPAWVFPDNLYSTKSVAEAATHEVGHHFALDHDGPGYAAGHGSWAPIMGAAYSRPISQWSRGDYSGADNREDDVAVIASHGAPLRADEAGSTPAGAAPLRAGNAYIASAADRDVFALGQCAGGLMSLTANPAPVSPNLDIRLRLLNANGSVVASADPLSSFVSTLLAKGLNASIARIVPAGIYFVEVDGVGSGSATTGYDDYGSIGAYTLKAPGCSQQTTSQRIGPPSAPRIGTATGGRPGGASTARVTWRDPVTNGGSAITGFKVLIYRKQGGTFRSTGMASTVPSSRHSSHLRLQPGTYKFAVRARTKAGFGPLSRKSTAADAR